MQGRRWSQNPQGRLLTVVEAGAEVWVNGGGFVLGVENGVGVNILLGWVVSSLVEF